MADAIERLAGQSFPHEAIGEVNALFLEWSLFHGGKRDEKPGVVGIYALEIPEGSDDEQAAAEQRLRGQAEKKFEEVIAALPDSAKAQLDLGDDERTRAVDEEELSVAAMRLSWKLEWDYLSYSGDPDAATPAR